MGKNRLHEKIVRINNTDIDTTGVNNSTTTYLYDESEKNRKNFEKVTSIEDRDDIDRDILKDRRNGIEMPKSEDSKKMFLSESLFEEDNNIIRYDVNEHEWKEFRRYLDAFIYNVEDKIMPRIVKESGLDMRHIYAVAEYCDDKINEFSDKLNESATRLRKPNPLFDDLYDEILVRLMSTPSDDVLKKSEHRHLIGKYSDTDEIIIGSEDGYSTIKVVTPIKDDRLGYARKIADEYYEYGVDTEYSKDGKNETLKFIIPEGDSPYDAKRMAEYEKKKSDKK